MRVLCVVEVVVSDLKVLKKQVFIEFWSLERSRYFFTGSTSEKFSYKDLEDSDHAENLYIMNSL